MGRSMLLGLAVLFDHIGYIQATVRHCPSSMLIEAEAALRDLLRHYPLVYTDDIRTFMGGIVDRVAAEAGKMAGADVKKSRKKYLSLMKKWERYADELPVFFDASVPNADALLFDRFLSKKRHWWEGMTRRKQKLGS